MGAGRGPLVYAIVSDLQSWLKLSLDAVLVAVCKTDKLRHIQTDSITHRHGGKQSDRQTVVTKVGACRCTLKLLARHERDESMTKAGQMHAHL